MPGSRVRAVSFDARSRVRAVSFDAGGTLIGVVEPVGATYAHFARRAGFTADADALDQGFRRAFAAAPPLAPGPGHAGTLLEFELGWWRAIVAASLAHALGEPVPASQGAAFERFFAATFAHYGERAAWRIFPDAADAVRALRSDGLVLAVLSNFDRRLHGLVAAFGLADAFAAVVPSSEAGFAKPALGAFEHVRGRLDAAGGFTAGACLHVGDSIREDVAGAVGAGFRAAWIDRDGAAAHELPAGASRITSLAELPGLLRQPSS